MSNSDKHEGSESGQKTTASVTEPETYKSTAIACYFGAFVQAIVINLIPILFIPLKDLYGLTYSQLGFLVLINFVTQISVDVIFSGLADKHGFRGLSILGLIFACLGLCMFALTPFLFSNIYLGFVISTMVFSGGGGLLEMILSPIVDTIPTDVKATAMSVLHAAFAWGSVCIIIVTTLFIYIFGSSSWQIILALWIIVPIIDIILFSIVPMCKPIPAHELMNLTDLLKHPVFIVTLIAIMVGGASEVTMSQWASAFLERGLNLPKIFGDLLGVAVFSTTFGIGRSLYGKYGKKIDLHKVLIFGSISAAICYLVVGLCLNPIFPVVFAGLCGISVALLWPGTLVIASEKFPKAGARMFALMAAAGDIGCSLGPWILSLTADNSMNSETTLSISQALGLTVEQVALRTGMLVGVIFPILSLICHVYLRKKAKVITKK